GGDGQMQGIVACCAGLSLLDHVLQAWLKSRDITHYMQPDATLFQLNNLLFQRLHEQPHQDGNFFLGATPVFRAESKKGQIFDAPLAACLNHFAYSLDTTHMACCPGQKSLGCPTAIS